MLLGQIVRLQSGQRTVTVNEQQLELPALSVAQQITVVVPSGKMDPGGGRQITESSWQLSAASGNGYFTPMGAQFGVRTRMLVGDG